MTLRVVDDTEGARHYLSQCGYVLVPPYRGVSIVDDDNVIHGAVGIDFYDGCDCHVSAYGNNYWTKSVLQSVFGWIFNQLGCDRATFKTLAQNAHTVRALEFLGAKHEGTKRRSVHGQDELLYGMLRDECRFIKGR
jgi:RimJ/RimL family protein N-acetyltransferase